MDNNDALRRIRYIFDFEDLKMMDLFLKGGLEVSRAKLSDWLKKEDHPNFRKLYDKNMNSFLNGLIIEKRGKKEGVEMKIEPRINNNLVLKKLKIALSLKSEDMLTILHSIDESISPHELSAFFRNPKQSQYRECQDQFLRVFLKGLQLKYRP